MTATVTPADASNRNVTWSVNDCDKNGNVTNSQENADINGAGMLITYNEGYVKVTATANDGGGATGTIIVRITNFNSTNFNSTTGINPEVEIASTYTILETSADTEETKAIKEALAAANFAWDDFSDLPADVYAALGDEYTKVSEMVTVDIPTGLNVFCFKKMFQTPFKARDKVMCLIAIPRANGEVEWSVVSGEIDVDGAVLMTLSERLYNKTAGKKVVYIPVQK